MRFGAKKTEKCDFLRKSAIFREKVQNFGKFRLFGPEITFWAPGDPRTLVKWSAGVRIRPRTLVKWSAGVRIRVHFSGRKRRGRGGLFSTLFPAPSPPLRLSSSYPTPSHSGNLFSATAVRSTLWHLKVAPDGGMIRTRAPLLDILVRPDHRGR